MPFVSEYDDANSGHRRQEKNEGRQNLVSFEMQNNTESQKKNRSYFQQMELEDSEQSDCKSMPASYWLHHKSKSHLQKELPNHTSNKPEQDIWSPSKACPRVQLHPEFKDQEAKVDEADVLPKQVSPGSWNTFEIIKNMAKSKEPSLLHNKQVGIPETMFIECNLANPYSLNQSHSVVISHLFFSPSEQSLKLQQIEREDAFGIFKKWFDELLQMQMQKKRTFVPLCISKYTVVG